MTAKLLNCGILWWWAVNVCQPRRHGEVENNHTQYCCAGPRATLTSNLGPALTYLFAPVNKRRILAIMAPFRELSLEEDRIARAALTLQEAFLDFREATWHSFVADIFNEGKSIAVIEGLNQTRDRLNGWFAQFPHYMGLDEHEKAAVLTMMSGHELGHMQKLVNQMYEEQKRIEANRTDNVPRHGRPPRRSAPLSPPHRPPHHTCPQDGRFGLNDYDYWLMRVTSRATGKQWALDLMGPQYDIQLLCFRWTTMMNSFAEKELSVQPFGTLATYTAELVELKGMMGMGLEVGAQAMQAFHDVVDARMDNKGLSWNAILDK
ncbi:hypothetical protein EJ02DRAFT_488220 [Clathrospora elynae]|uniref:Uncharacterized protein n=1 Tax=Clathrospora elynae TaxID=706981 RepID=A0A6A5SSG3_9PLEO|nr:hypothetical protein EJ02DRAFT_488220 [Clathrospora elynae]